MLRMRVLERSRSPWPLFWIFRTSVTLSCRTDLGEREVVRLLNALLNPWHALLEEIEPGLHRVNSLDGHFEKHVPADDCVVRIDRPAPDRIRISLRGLFVLDGLTLAGFALIALVVVPEVAPWFPSRMAIPFLVLYLVHGLVYIRAGRRGLDFLLESLSLQEHPAPHQPRRVRAPRGSR